MFILLKLTINMLLLDGVIKVHHMILRTLQTFGLTESQDYYSW